MAGQGKKAAPYNVLCRCQKFGSLWCRPFEVKHKHQFALICTDKDGPYCRIRWNKIKVAA